MTKRLAAAGLDFSYLSPRSILSRPADFALLAGTLTSASAALALAAGWRYPGLFTGGILYLCVFPFLLSSRARHLAAALALTALAAWLLPLSDPVPALAAAAAAALAV